MERLGRGALPHQWSASSADHPGHAPPPVARPAPPTSHPTGPPPAPPPPVPPPHLSPAEPYGPATTVAWTPGGPDPDVGDVVTFDWEVSTDPAFGTLLDFGSGATVAAPGPFTTQATTTYYGRARANDSWEVSAWSPWQFTSPAVAASLLPTASFL